MRVVTATPAYVMPPAPTIPVPHVPLPPAPSHKREALPTRQRPVKTMRWGWMAAAVGGAFLLLIAMGALVVVGAVSGGVLPGVSVGSVRVGGKSITQATRLLADQAQTITLQADGQTWDVSPSELGLQLDAAATAQRAYDEGRDNGNFMSAVFGRVSVAPVVNFDIAAAEAYLLANEATYSVQPVNAGVALVNGEVQATPPQNGALLDIQGTLAKLMANPASVWQQDLELVTLTVAPNITDASAALDAARTLLTNPLEIRVFDPVTGDSLYWSSPPQEWGTWLTAIPDSNSPIGLSLNVQDAPLRDFLQAQSTVFDASRTIDIDAGIANLQNALAAGNPRSGYIVVKHLPTTYTVQSGESLTSIAWNVGMPYPYIQQANGGRDNFGAGETITIPPADTFLLYEPVPDKRIVVSISNQRVQVYENGQMIQDWAASTGINDSPTWKGLYQIISHEQNAYAGNWNLYMPYFLGVYMPIPNADFTNGFHGFPTRGGGQILWENSIGTKVTYGCILVNNTNAAWLYNWAQEGVVVEIQG